MSEQTPEAVEAEAPEATPADDNAETIAAAEQATERGNTDWSSDVPADTDVPSETPIGDEVAAEMGNDNDLTAEDVNAAPSAAEPDEMGGTAEATDEGLEHDPANPETEEGE